MVLRARDHFVGSRTLLGIDRTKILSGPSIESQLKIN